jgi:hypothetical protein
MLNKTFTKYMTNRTIRKLVKPPTDTTGKMEGEHMNAFRHDVRQSDNKGSAT